MNLKTQARLESMKGKCFMHHGTNHTIIDFLEVNNQVILSTDVRTIVFSTPEEIDTFIKDCLPVDNAITKQSSSAMVTIPGMDQGVFGELGNGLMSSFREIQGATGTDEKFLKQATERAKTKLAISKGMTDIVKTIIAGKKAMKEK